MADTFVKLWASILDSSVWSEPPETRVVWVAMLAMADANGFVGASEDGIARRANVSLECAQKAIAAFEAPDLRSRSKVEEGRRIRRVERGWHVINHKYFRDLRDKEARQAYERERKREQRARARVSGTGSGRGGTKGRLSPMSAHAEASASASPDAELPPSEEGTSFHEFWKVYDHKKAKIATEKVWRRIKPDADLAARIVAAAKVYRDATPDKNFRKHPATWLNGGCWDDEPPVARAANGKPPSKPVEHMRGLPVGTPSCGCEACVRSRGGAA